MTWLSLTNAAFCLRSVLKFPDRKNSGRSSVPLYGGEGKLRIFSILNTFHFQGRGLLCAAVPFLCVLLVTTASL